MISMNIVAKNIPEELVSLPQWVLWRYEDRGAPKPTKVPYQARTRLYHAKSDDPRTWASFEAAIEMYQHHAGHIDGIGFAFSAADCYCGIDLDRIWLSDADEGAPWAIRILEQFADTYSEVSPSDFGVKIWCKAKAPRCGSWPIEHGAIEVYDHSRYFAVTGRAGRVHAITDHQSDVEALVAHLDEDDVATTSRRPTITGGTIPQGQRHPTLVSLGGTMWKRGMCPAAIEAALLKTNEEQCDPPYPPDHIHKIVASMARWER